MIVLCLIYTVTNGFQDGSSVAATPIMSRAMTKYQTIILVSSFEFLGAIFGGSRVANTIHDLSSYPIFQQNLLTILASALLGAILWNYITRIIKFPSSSTHALVGGILGSLWAVNFSFVYVVWGNLNYVFNSTGIYKIVISLFLSPILGLVFGSIVYKLLLMILIKSSTRVNVWLKKLQLPVTAILSFGHGANDTQKAMGVMILALECFGHQVINSIPLWVRILEGVAMAIGIFLLAQGIVRRVGSGIYKLKPVHALACQITSSSIIVTGSVLGGPVSTSQIIASSVMGVGTADRYKGVHWYVAKDMFVAWCLTIPISAIISALLYLLIFKNI